MRSSIIEKISRISKSGVKSEAETLYVLAQIRKYRESSGSRNERNKTYPNLSLVTDWVLHSKLTGSLAVNKLNEYSDFFKKTPDDYMPKFMSSGFSLFFDLKRELQKFFEENQIDNCLLSGDNWKSFATYLYEILKDLPLVSDGDIKQFIFEDDYLGLIPSMISFKLTFSDGGIKSFSVDSKLIQ